MNNEPDPMQPNRDQRLTDFLCGELDAAAARALEAELAADPALQARLADLRRALELVREDAPALTEGLPPARREALRAAAAAAALQTAAGRDGHAGHRALAADAPAPAGRLLRMPVWLRAAAALLLVVGGAFLWRTTRPEAGAAAEGLSAQAPAEESWMRKLESLGYSEAGEAKAEAGSIGWRQIPPAGAPAAPGMEEALMALGYVDSTQRDTALRVAPAPASEFGAFLSQADAETSDLARQDGGVDLLESEIVPGFALSQPLLERGAPATSGGAAGDLSSFRPNKIDSPAPDQDRAYRDEEPAFGGTYAGPGDNSDASSELRARAALTDGYGRAYRNEELLGHLRRHGNETPRDMFFRYYGDNASVRANEDPLSTFAADVDTASYALVRNYLTQGNLPPKAAVRTEEFVNSFQQELTPPRDGDFAVTLEAAPTPYGAAGSLLLRCAIKAREVSRAERKPLNLVFVVDKSGSMAEGGRLALVQSALELLVDQIRDDDTVGLVAFDSEGHEILAPTPGAERYKIREALRGLTSGGSTNAAEGLFMGYKMAEGAFRKNAVNRVVLASDGVANTGETDQQRILEKVRKSAEAAIDLTSIGVGMNNHNDVFLEQLADAGEGSCHYVDGLDEAKRVLVDGFTGTMQVVAREVKIQLEFDPAAVASWRQLGYENRALRHEDFRNDRVDAGEVGAGHAVVALYELQLRPEAEDKANLATLRLRWKPDGSRKVEETATVLRAGEARSRWSQASPRLRLDGAVAQFAEFLRRSVHARGDSYELLRQDAARLARELEDAQVAEFRDLVERAAALVQQLWPEDDLALLIEEARRGRLMEAELECVRERTPDVEELLKEARLHNAELEKQLQDLLQPR